MDTSFGSDLDLFIRLMAALVFGGIIGLNRDMHGKPAGIRLHALVACGAAIFVLTAGFINGPGDVTRALQGVVGGIGFLGAGVIIRVSAPGEKTQRLQNLTTAATIWSAAALGCSCGMGSYKLSICAFIAILFILVVGARLDHEMFGRLGHDQGDIPDHDNGAG